MTFEQMIARTRTDHRPFSELRGGNLGVRVACSAAEIDAVQALRYRVFYQEMGAKADVATTASLRDRDAFDAVADHLLVVDHAIGDGPEGVVGTYRLIQREAAAQLGRFYSADEYDITAQRDGMRLLTFGAGIHYCVGANLARAEMQEGLVLLAETFREIRLDGEPQYGTPSGIYGLDSLPLRLTR